MLTLFARIVTWCAILLGTATLVSADPAPVAKLPIPEGVYVRIIVCGHAFKQEWDATGHTAQDVLKMIEQLKPDVLDRLVNGKQNPDLAVPVEAGSAPMTELQFLQAAMNAGAPGCTISPKIHLNNVWSDEYRFDAARSLRDLPLVPSLTVVDLDSWFSSPKDAAGNRQMLQKLRDMGWTQMITNPGPYKSAYGYESSVMTYPSVKTWLPPKAKINALHRMGVRLPLMHIDYPYQVSLFRRLSPDRQAQIISDISAAQRPMGFRFIYPVLYGHYDSTKVVTRKDGPYHGATIFQVIQQAITQYRQVAARP